MSTTTLRLTELAAATLVSIAVLIAALTPALLAAAPSGTTPGADALSTAAGIQCSLPAERYRA
jgi:hypothetical protein